MIRMTGADALLEVLKEQEVETIFGFPGGTVINIYDSIYKQKDVKHILTAHEQGATHAADGYARATGKIGVVLVTSGPGAANTVTGIATAYMDSVPMVVITGQVARSLLGKASFQELNITKITKTITKKNFQVMKPEDLCETVRQAFVLANTGRPGPVLVDIPKDIQIAMVDYEYKSKEDAHLKHQVETVEQTARQKSMLEKAARAINQSKRPMIYAGGGVKISNAVEELRRFAEKIKAPVSTSLMGTGVYPTADPQFVGMVGMHGFKYANTAFTHCDLIIAVGARFSDRATCKLDGFAPTADVIQIDIDPAELGKNLEVSYPLCGDVKTVLDNLTEHVEEKPMNGWLKQISDWKEEFKPNYKSNGELCPKFFIESLSKMVGDTAVITTEVGQNQMWTAQYFNFNDPRSFISSGGLGTMGFGMGAAIGAALGRPEKRVINIAGDGSFRMNLNELATLVQHKIPVMQIVLNNSSLGMVRQWQTIFMEERYSETDLPAEQNFQKIGEAFGVKSFKITKNSEVDSVLKEAMKIKGPVLVECMISPLDMVMPMVPAGQPISESIESF